MSRIAPRTAIANKNKRVTIQTLGAAVPDGQGGFTREPVAVASKVLAEVKAATAREVERVVASSVQSSVSHLVTIDYVRGVTTEAQVIFHDTIGDRTFSISGIDDPEEQHVELILACEETRSAA